MPRSGQVRIESEGLVHESRTVIELANHEGKRISGPTKCKPVITTELNRSPSQSLRFTDFMLLIADAAGCFAPSMAPRRKP